MVQLHEQNLRPVDISGVMDAQHFLTEPSIPFLIARAVHAIQRDSQAGGDPVLSTDMPVPREFTRILEEPLNNLDTPLPRETTAYLVGLMTEVITEWMKRTNSARLATTFININSKYPVDSFAAVKRNLQDAVKQANVDLAPGDEDAMAQLAFSDGEVERQALLELIPLSPQRLFLNALKREASEAVQNQLSLEMSRSIAPKILGVLRGRLENETTFEPRLMKPEERVAKGEDRQDFGVSINRDSREYRETLELIEASANLTLLGEQLSQRRLAAVINGDRLGKILQAYQALEPRLSRWVKGEFEVKNWTKINKLAQEVSELCVLINNVGSVRDPQATLTRIDDLLNYFAKAF